MTPLRFLLIGLLSLLLAGCAGEESVFKEIKHPHELIKISELNTYLQIVSQLPDQKLPQLPPLFAQLPEWELDRELSVKGLVKEEEKQNRDRWFNESLLAKLSHHHRLQKLLRKHQLSLPQFLGLAETINLAAARRHFEDDSELRQTMRMGQSELNELMKREDVFSKLPQEEQYELIRQAAWITRVNRAQNLLRIPEENRALIDKHFEILEPYLHPDVKLHPLQEIVDSQKQYGLPFQEMLESGSDATLRWSVNDPTARIGHDSLQQFTAKPASHVRETD